MPREITVQELARMQAAGESLMLLDVRQPEEHAHAAIPGSVLIPMNELPSRWQTIDVPDDVPLILYCHHGIRSWHAATYLEQCGLPDVRSLADGIDAWSLHVDGNVARY